MAPTQPCSFETFSSNFDLPLKVAAEKFGVRATAFKKRCRAIGIRHWPYRKVRSLKRNLAELQDGKENGQLTSKQETQIANLRKQLSGLMSPKTYGIESKDAIIPLSIKDTGKDDIKDVHKSNNKLGNARIMKHKPVNQKSRKQEMMPAKKYPTKTQKYTKSIPKMASGFSATAVVAPPKPPKMHQSLPLSTLSLDTVTPSLLDHKDTGLWKPELPPLLSPRTLQPAALSACENPLFIPESEQKIFGISLLSKPQEKAPLHETLFDTASLYGTSEMTGTADDFIGQHRYDEDFGDFLVDMDSEGGQHFLDDLSLDIGPLCDRTV